MKGLGLGAGSAKKLLSRYGSIWAAQQAAERGELAAWPPAVRDLLCDPRNERLSANLAATTLGTDASRMPASVRTMISSLRDAVKAQRPKADTAPLYHQLPAVTQWPIQQPAAAAKLAWHAPYACMRWGRVATAAVALADMLTAHGVRCCLQYASLEGLTADVVVYTAQPPGLVPIMLCAECDLSSPDGEASKRDDGAACVLTPNLLSRRMLAHVSLLKRVMRSGGQAVMCFAASCPTQRMHSLIVAAVDVAMAEQ